MNSYTKSNDFGYLSTDDRLKGNKRGGRGSLYEEFENILVFFRIVDDY